MKASWGRACWCWHGWKGAHREGKDRSPIWHSRNTSPFPSSTNYTCWICIQYESDHNSREQRSRWADSSYATLTKAWLLVPFTDNVVGSLILSRQRGFSDGTCVSASCRWKRLHRYLDMFNINGMIQLMTMGVGEPKCNSLPYQFANTVNNCCCYFHFLSDHW